MAKKKKGLAPVNRGFATTSQPKKAVPVVEEAPEAEEPVVNESNNLKDGKPGGGAKAGDQKNGTAADGKAAATGEDDWENEFELEEGIYQGYVERLQEKGEKEINRIIKAIDFDRRMNKGYITLNLEESLQEELLELNKTTVRRPAEPLKIPTTQQEKEKTLLKLYINFGVLTRLGYQEEKVLKCLEVVGEKGGWEEGLDWLLTNVGKPEQQK
ncbi:hypothetical protein HD553DRAFT_340801 [Filobasidium floriforme]|uniref:uncharacterized protein n=1 Tax=Filobasidium floriforme TaxID=5210 RepID=UPI001E8D8450|nr:uncharacterized protein HD553DRAFT_340801 [Filobasidium floriforme]KAH8086830.1 hypothetical protein HD553DRAFT_340801 [Filobasidium floriforme]